MADIGESAPFTDPATAISQGKRHLLVRDYTLAAGALAQACQLLAEKHGDTADELGEPYLLYGRALLGLAREEAGVLGGGVPGTEENNEDDDDDDEEGDDEKLSNVDEKEEEDEGEDAASAGTSEPKTKESTESKTDSTKTDVVEKTDDEKSEEKKEEPTDSADKEDEENRTDDSKIAEQKAQESKSEEEPAVAGSSKGSTISNGPSTSAATQNGDIRQNGEEEAEDVSKEDDDEEANNLQVAWEVLELAKLVLLKRGEKAWKLLADAYRLLGEVAMEGGNHQGALNDLQGCLDLLHKIKPNDARAIAEIHYQLALAHSLGNEFDASIEQFNKATELLQARIKELEDTKEPPKADDSSFYTVEGEIKELKELLPEIQEKITDMKDFKEEACRLVIEGIKSKVAGGCSNGAGPSSGEGSSSSSSKVQGPASDISHLVRKKRKADEPESESPSPCKKPTPEKAV